MRQLKREFEKLPVIGDVQVAVEVRVVAGDELGVLGQLLLPLHLQRGREKRSSGRAARACGPEGRGAVGRGPRAAGRRRLGPEGPEKCVPGTTGWWRDAR